MDMDKVASTGLVLALVFGLCRCLEVKIGLLFSEGFCCDFKSIENKAGAISIALDQIYLDGVLDRSVTFR